VRKVERRGTRRYTDRLKAVSERLDRLIAVARQLRAQMEAALARDPLYHFRPLVSRDTPSWMPFSSGLDWRENNYRFLGATASTACARVGSAVSGGGCRT